MSMSAPSTDQLPLTATSVFPAIKPQIPTSSRDMFRQVSGASVLSSYCSTILHSSPFFYSPQAVVSSENVQFVITVKRLNRVTAQRNIGTIWSSDELPIVPTDDLSLSSSSSSSMSALSPSKTMRLARRLSTIGGLKGGVARRVSSRQVSASSTTGPGLRQRAKQLYSHHSGNHQLQVQQHQQHQQHSRHCQPSSKEGKEESQDSRRSLRKSMAVMPMVDGNCDSSTFANNEKLSLDKRRSIPAMDEMLAQTSLEPLTEPLGQFSFEQCDSEESEFPIRRIGSKLRTANQRLSSFLFKNE